MKKLIISISLLMIFTGVFAQRVYFCENYTPTGDPIAAGNVWTITSSGGYVYILFKNADSSPMPSSIVFNISKLSGTDYAPFDVQTVTPEAGKNFALLDYKFMTSGSYKISVKDNNFKELTSDFVTIKDKEVTTTTTTSTSTTTSTASYTYATVSTGTSIDSYGILTSKNSEYYTIPTTGAYVTFKVDNAGTPINSSGLVVDIYKADSYGKYEFYETKEYDITSTFDWVYFQYTFYTAGNYKFSVYNKEWKYINMVYVTIKYQ